MQNLREKYDVNYTSATCYVCRDLWKRIHYLEEQNSELQFAAEGMVAAFDIRPDGEPETITQPTREAALNNAKQILGWK